MSFFAGVLIIVPLQPYSTKNVFNIFRAIRHFICHLKQPKMGLAYSKSGQQNNNNSNVPLTPSAQPNGLDSRC